MGEVLGPIDDEHFERPFEGLEPCRLLDLPDLLDGDDLAAGPFGLARHPDDLDIGVLAPEDAAALTAGAARPLLSYTV